MGLKGSHNNIVSGVYCITNIVNDMKYIGCSKNIYRRIYSHTSPSRYPNAAISKAIQEFGVENFELKILETGKDIFEREIYWIKKLKTRSPNGYNLTDGGAGPSGIKATAKMMKVLIERNKRPRSAEYKKNMSEGQKKTWIGTDRRKNFSGKNHHHYGENIKESAREKMKEHYKHHRVWARKNVNMIDIKTGEVLLCFTSMKNATIWLGGKPNKNGWYPSSPISNVCRGKNKTAHGYKWQYNNERTYKNGK